MHSLEHKIPPPVVGAVVAAAMWGLASFQPFLHLPPFARHAAVAAFVAGGVAFNVLGLLAFRRARTTINPLKPGKTSALVTDGIYRFTRNPMYVGIALLLHGLVGDGCDQPSDAPRGAPLLIAARLIQSAAAVYSTLSEDRCEARPRLTASRYAWP